MYESAWKASCLKAEARARAAEGRLKMARELLEPIRDSLIDRDPPYAVMLDRVIAVLRGNGKGEWSSTCPACGVTFHVRPGSVWWTGTMELGG